MSKLQWKTFCGNLKKVYFFYSFHENKLFTTKTVSREHFQEAWLAILSSVDVSHVPTIRVCTLTLADKQFTNQSGGTCCEGLIHSVPWRLHLLSLDLYRGDSLWQILCTENMLCPFAEQTHTLLFHSWALQVACACCLSGAVRGHISAWLSWIRWPQGSGVQERSDTPWCIFVPKPLADQKPETETWFTSSMDFTLDTMQLSKAWLALFLSPCGTFCSSVFKQFQVLCKHKDHGRQPS